MRSVLQAKKGQSAFEDVFFILAFLLFAGIMFFILYFVFGQIKAPMSEALQGAIPDGTATVNVTDMAEQTSGGVGMFNTVFPLLIIGLVIMVMVSASMMNSHPVFFFVSLLILGVAVILGVVFSNVYQQITEDANFADTANKFTITTVFMKYLPFFIVVTIIIVMIIMYGKVGGGGSGQL